MLQLQFCLTYKLSRKKKINLPTLIKLVLLVIRKHLFWLDMASEFVDSGTPVLEAKHHLNPTFTKAFFEILKIKSEQGCMAI
jgi:hypothetical protein